MSKFKQLNFQESIDAPADKVWEIMFGEQTFRQWRSAFGEGFHYDGSWSEGSTIRFLDPAKNGTVAEIAENKLHEYVSVRHLGYVDNGIDDTESESVKAWAPAYENYTFTDTGQGTKVTVAQDVAEEYENYMAESWSIALSGLKELCES